VDNCPSYLRRDLQNELCLVQQAVSTGVSHQRSNATDNTWSTWSTFYASLNIDPTLQHIDDPIIPLQLFAHRYRHGQASPSKTAVRSKTVGDALRSVGQTITNLVFRDPRLQPSGKLNFRLSRQLSSYNKQDPPPSRVKPIPCSILSTTVHNPCLAHHPRSHTIADMLTLGFYFLLQPGEYAQTTNPESTPFRLMDIHLKCGNTPLPHLTCTLAHIDAATFVCLEFTNQKNGVRGELIGLSRSGNPAFCPVQACINRIKHLRTFHAPPHLPLYAFFSTSWQGITTTRLTTELRNVVTITGHSVGLLPSDISIRSLRASGAMALLCANVDTDRIRLLGHWRSDEMLRYLHVQTHQVVTHLAPAMLDHGDFQLIPNLPPTTGPLPVNGVHEGL
jgi:hypothetical protein